MPTLDLAYEPAYAHRVERMKASEIRELLKLLDNPGIISFAGGIPDPTLEDTVNGILKFMHRKGIISIAPRERELEPTPPASSHLAWTDA